MTALLPSSPLCATWPGAQTRAQPRPGLPARRARNHEKIQSFMPKCRAAARLRKAPRLIDFHAGATSIESRAAVVRRLPTHSLRGNHGREECSVDARVGCGPDVPDARVENPARRGAAQHDRCTSTPGTFPDEKPGAAAETRPGVAVGSDAAHARGIRGSRFTGAPRRSGYSEIPPHRL